MEDNALIFWENVKKEIKSQNTTQEWVAQKSGISFNTFQGWMSKGIFPRVNEAERIAVSLNVSIEYLLNGAVPNNKPVEIICQNLPKIQEHLDRIKEAVKELQ
jgi:transcriptional regulator with XRE-family HTH domain